MKLRSGPSHQEGQQLLKLTEHTKLGSQITKLKRKQTTLKELCIHPETHLQIIDKEYHPNLWEASDCWTEYHCYQCDKVWTEDCNNKTKE